MGEFLGIAFGGVLLSMVTLGVVFLVVHPLSASSCRQYALQTNRETKFVDYNYASYECLVKTSDGKWLPKSQLTDIVKKEN